MAIKKLLRSEAHFGILEGFLSELLKRDLIILEVLDSKSNQNNQDEKRNGIEILVKLDNGEMVLIEIQVDSEPDYFCRMPFGTAQSIIERIDIKKVYSVNILYCDLCHGDDYIYHGTTNFMGINTNNKLEPRDKQLHQIYPEYYLINSESV